MTELDLYKFITENDLEYRWQDNKGEEDLLIWIPFYLLEDFTKMINLDYIGESYLDVVLQSNAICLFLSTVCYAYNIDIETVVEK